MLKSDNAKSVFSIIVSMFFFGTIGLFRKNIEMTSGLLAFCRGILGCVFIVFFIYVFKKRKLSKEAIKHNLVKLIISGGLIGINWVFLFEAYNYTSVATATLCYYMAPVFMMIGTALFFKEKLGLKKIICILLSITGMVLVSGVTDEGFSGISGLKGILYGLAAAVLYAGVILLNNRMDSIDALDKTSVQLVTAAIVILPYVLASTQWGDVSFSIRSAILLIIVCIVHTGICYTLCFGAMAKVSAQTYAVLSYIDPVVALVLSQGLATLLPSLLPGEKPLSLSGIIGGLLILGSAVISEFRFSKVKNND